MSAQLYKITLVLDGTVDKVSYPRVYHVYSKRGVVAAINRVLARVDFLVTENPERKLISLTLEEIEPFLTVNE